MVNTDKYKSIKGIEQEKDKFEGEKKDYEGRFVKVSE